MKAQVGMKVKAYTGSCIGILIQSTEWNGEIIKVTWVLRLLTVFQKP